MADQTTPQQDPSMFPSNEDEAMFPAIGGATAANFRVRSPEQANRTATLAAFAALKQNKIDISQFNTAIDTNLNRLNNGEEGDMRAEFDFARRTEIGASMMDALGPQAAVKPTDMSPDPNTLEQEGVDQITNMGLDDPTQANVEKNYAPLRDMMVDRQKKIAILQERMDSYRKEYENSPAALRIVDWLGATLPFSQGSRQRETLGDLSNTLQLPGSRSQQERANLLDLPMDEFKARVDKMDEVLRDPEGVLRMNNPLINSQIMQDLALGANPNTENLLTAVDVATMVPLPTTQALKAAENPLRFGAVLNRDLMSSTAMARIMAPVTDGAVKPVIDTMHALDVLLPSYAANTSELAVGLSGDILRKMRDQEQLARLAIDSTMRPRLTGEHAAEAIDAAKTAIKKQYDPTSIVDIRNAGIDEHTGMHRLEIIMGKANGVGGYDSEASALSGMRNRGLLGSKVFQDPNSSQWFISIPHAVPEQGFAPLYYGGEGVTRTGMLANTTAFAHWGPESLVSMQNEAADLNERMASLMNQITKPVRSLNAESRLKVEALLEKMHNEERWMTAEEFRNEFDQLHGRYPNNGETNAYFAFKRFNDFNYALLNRKVYLDEARAGFIRVEIPELGYKGNGIPLNQVEDASKMRIHDVTNNVIYDSTSPLTNEGLKKMQEEGYVLYRLSRKKDLPVVGGKYTDLVIGKRGEFQTGPIEFNQLPYRAGGNRIYAKNIRLVKQARILETTEGKQILDPYVHGASESYAKAQSYADRMEHLRQTIIAYRKGEATDETLHAAFADTEVSDLEHWDQLVKDGRLAENTPFEHVADGELPRAMLGVDNPIYMTDHLPMDDRTTLLLNRGKKFYGYRGEGLRGLDGEEVRVLSPLEAMNEAMHHAMRTGVYYNYKALATESWFNSFKDFLVNGNKITPSEALFNPLWGTKVEKEVIDRGMAVRNNIIRQLNIKPKEMRDWINAKEQIAAWVEDKTGIEYTFTKDMLDKNAIGTFRRWARRIQLGLGDPGQFLVQMQTAVQAATMHPLYGSQAWASGPLMRFSLYDKGVAKIAARDLLGVVTPKFMDKANWLNMIDMAERSGFMDLSNNMGLFAEAVPTKVGRTKLTGIAATTTDWLKKGKNFLLNDVGDFFLRESERTNRIVAWQIAYREAMDDAGKGVVLKATPELERKLRDRAHILINSMSSASRNWTQEGIQSLASQYSGFLINQVDLLLGKKLTTAEKTRYVVGSMLLYGSASVPGARGAMDYIVTKYNQLNPDNPMDGAMYRQLTTGVYDALLYWATGGEADTSFGTRAGMGAGIESLFKSLNDKNVLAFAGGPAGLTDSKFANSLWEAAKYLRSAYAMDKLDGEAGWVALKDIARNSKSYSQFERAWLLHRGIDMTRQGIYAGDGTDAQALAVILGMPLREDVDGYIMLRNDQERRKDARDIANRIIGIRTRAINAKTKEEFQSYALQERTWYEGLKDDPVQEQMVLDQIKANTPTEFYQAMVNRELQAEPYSGIGQAAIGRNKQMMKKGNQ